MVKTRNWCFRLRKQKPFIILGNFYRDFERKLLKSSGNDERKNRSQTSWCYPGHYLTDYSLATILRHHIIQGESFLPSTKKNLFKLQIYGDDFFLTFCENFQKWIKCLGLHLYCPLWNMSNTIGILLRR